jgi:hypothetical protein
MSETCYFIGCLIECSFVPNIYKPVVLFVVCVDQKTYGAGSDSLYNYADLGSKVFVHVISMFEQL